LGATNRESAIVRHDVGPEDVNALIQRPTAAIERALLAARWHEMDGEEASTIFGQGGRGARECP
jgi:hypothetical protein